MTEFDKRLIPNYIYAAMFFAVFLWGCTFVLLNWEELVTDVTNLDTDQALIVGGVGGALISALILNVKDIVQFFFRTAPS